MATSAATRTDSRRSSGDGTVREAGGRQEGGGRGLRKEKGGGGSLRQRVKVTNQENGAELKRRKGFPEVRGHDFTYLL